MQSRILCCLFCILMDYTYTTYTYMRMCRSLRVRSPLTICVRDTRMSITRSTCAQADSSPDTYIYASIWCEAEVILPNRIRAHRAHCMQHNCYYGISPLRRPAHMRTMSAICWRSPRGFCMLCVLEELEAV